MLSRAAHDAGAVLRADFDRRVHPLPSLGEVALFRAPSDALGAWRVPSMIETTEFHGRTYQVEHQTVAPASHLGAKWCEPCDVVIASYSPGVQQARLTFLQAKYERTYPPMNGMGLAANMVQWSLLGGRARITDHVSTFRPPPPPDLLPSAVLPSIASFGFFYPGLRAEIEMAFASADRLWPYVPPNVRANSKYGRLAFPAVPPSPLSRGCQGGCPVELRIGAASDLSVAFDLEHLGAGLASLLVGTPVSPGTAVGGWLSSFVSEVAAAQGLDPVLAGLADVLDVRATDGHARDEAPLLEEPGEHPSLVVVRTTAGEG